MIKKDLEIGSDLGMGIRNVASARLKEKSSSMSCTMKYGKSPVDLRMVMHCYTKHTKIAFLLGRQCSGNAHKKTNVQSATFQRNSEDKG